MRQVQTSVGPKPLPKEERLSWRIDEWPGDDQRRWNEAMQQGGIFDDPGDGGHLRSGSKALYT